MKQKIFIAILTLFVLIFTACSPAQTPLPATVPPTQPVSQIQYHPLDTLTNIPDLDVVIKAVASDDPQQLRERFQYAMIPCMTVNALGGPPACRDGEAEGTPVEVLPSRGPEGSFLHKDEEKNFPALNALGVYAIYRAPESAHSDPNYPSGEYGIVYWTDGDTPDIDLQVTDGKIVRIDYIFGYPESNELLPPGVTDFVLEPVSK